MKYIPLTNKLQSLISSRLVLIIGALLGFSTSIVAQYGAPVAKYKLSGTLKSKCEDAIPGVKVSIKEYQNSSYEASTVYTDSLGKFELIYWSDDWTESVKMFLTAEDVDGNSGKGSFNSLSKTVFLRRISYKDNKEKYPNINLVLEYTGTPPCKQIESDTLPENVPLLSLPDTMLFAPGKINETFYAEISDTITNQTNRSDKDYSAFLVYPNPSTGSFSLQINGFENKLITVYVYDTNSKMVYYDKITQPAKFFEFQMDLTNNSNGTYYLVVFAGKKKFMQKLIIAN